MKTITQALEDLGISLGILDSDGDFKRRVKTVPYCTSLRCSGSDAKAKIRKYYCWKPTFCLECGYALWYGPENPDE